MGEAKRRADAYASGRPWQPRPACPSCKSPAVSFSRSKLALSHVETLYGFCGSCLCIWEAYPADWHEEPVGAPPCDNCAFAAGSPESSDLEGWRNLLAKLKHGQEFRCHKGAPIKIDAVASTAEFDADWIQANGRMCAGFLRAMQQWPDWLVHRYGTAHVLTTYDQDRLLGAEAVDAEAEAT